MLQSGRRVEETGGRGEEGEGEGVRATAREVKEDRSLSDGLYVASMWRRLEMCRRIALRH